MNSGMSLSVTFLEMGKCKELIKRSSRSEKLSKPSLFRNRRRPNLKGLVVPSRRRKLGFYSALGLNIGATKEEIHSAWRRLSFKCNPDRCFGQQKSAATRLQKRLNNAKDTLLNDEIREE